jgi:ribonuclease HI
LTSAGFNDSSTRAEILSIIAALLDFSPAHIACDNQVAVNATKLIVDRAAQSKPWALCKNGDLLAILQRVAIARPAHSIAITKVKGHATDEHIAQGLATVQQRNSNEAADKLATSAWNNIDETLVRFHHYLDVRTVKYAAFMGIWSRYLVHIFTVAEKYRKRSIS